MEEKYTIGSIILYGIVILLFLELILAIFVNILASTETIEHSRPSDPILARIYDTFSSIYNFLKPILTTKEGLAGLVAVDMVLIGFFVEWRKSYD